MLLLKILHIRTDAREIIDHYIHEISFCQRMNSIISKLDHLNTKNCKVCLYFLIFNLFYLIFVVCNNSCNVFLSILHLFRYAKES